MKMEDALDIINKTNKLEGYMVHFERVDGEILRSNYFPDGETLIKTKEEARILAGAFASKTFGECVNIYIIDEQFRPVDKFRIENR